MADLIKVFVSSTSLGLGAVRAQVIAALHQLNGFHVVNMENFTAHDAPAAITDARYLEDCELFIGLLGPFYGQTPTEQLGDISYTEREYEDATERGLPRLMFLSSKSFGLLQKDYDTELPWKQDQQRAFRKRIPKQHVVSFFDDASQLATHVVTATANWRLTGVASVPEPIPEDKPTSGSGSEETSIVGCHEAYAAKLLGEHLAHPFLRELIDQLDDMNIEHPKRTDSHSVVQWLNQKKLDTDEDLLIFEAIRTSLNKYSERLSQPPTEAILKKVEHAASALYCIVALRFIDGAGYKSNDFVIQVPPAAPVICGLVVAALFGGRVILEHSDDDPKLPNSRHTYDVDLKPGHLRPEHELEWQFFTAVRKKMANETDEALAGTPLTDDQRGVLRAMCTPMRGQAIIPAVVLKGHPENKGFHSFGETYKVRVVLTADDATALFRIDIADLRGHFQWFWETRPSRHQAAGRPAPKSNAVSQHHE